MNGAPDPQALLRGPVSVRRVERPAAPLAVYRRLYPDEPLSFLYESLEIDGRHARYSLLGGRPLVVLRARGRQVQLGPPGALESLERDPLELLRSLLGAGPAECGATLPFAGGALGYIGYDVVRLIEHLPAAPPDELGAPDIQLIFPSEIVVFDHLEQAAWVVLHGPASAQRCEWILQALQADSPPTPAAHASSWATDPGPDPDEGPATALPRSNLTAARFQEMVEQAREYIRAGDIFQVVLSQRFEFPWRREPLALFEALRQTNPSPYMYYLHLGDLHVAGSSPEVLVRLTGRTAVTRPLAGTRRRGRTPEEDRRLARELLEDEKERAEHVMLVDLGRNDLGRVCAPGSVRATEVLQLERFSRVMHLVSTVQGTLAPGRDAIDLLRAAFPAGTVCGAPKVRAMQIIDELEPTRRGVYAGAIGYIGYAGNMDACIAIRTIVLRRRADAPAAPGPARPRRAHRDPPARADAPRDPQAPTLTGYIQAGAGIVADSLPQREYQETVNKARALLAAVRRGSADPHPQ